MLLQSTDTGHVVLHHSTGVPMQDNHNVFGLTHKEVRYLRVGAPLSCQNLTVAFNLYFRLNF